MNVGRRILTDVANHEERSRQEVFSFYPQGEWPHHRVRVADGSTHVRAEVSTGSGDDVRLASLTLSGAPALSDDESAARHAVVVAALEEMPTRYGPFLLQEEDHETPASLLRTPPSGNGFWEIVVIAGGELHLRHFSGSSGQLRCAAPATMSPADFCSLIDGLVERFSALQLA